LPEQFRRTDPRYERRVEVQITAGDKTQVAHTKNISLGGMFAETNEMLPVQTAIQIKFHVPTQREAIEVGGEVRWIERSGGAPPGMGVRFHGLRARDVWALNRFFHS
jgi:uncharacterized protein (TIGR02266 family)